MLERILNLTFFVLATGLIWYLNKVYYIGDFEKLYYTGIAFTITYLVFKLILQEIVSKPIKDEKTKYSFKKTVSIINWIIFSIIFIRIWIKNPQALLVAYGLVAAGIAIALQDYFKNFVGGIMLFINGMYRVGDRIEVDGEFGDVIDISLLYTTVMEMREWVNGDQATGRICTIPNGFVISKVVNNYTRDYSFIWDEITVPITYDSAWKEAVEKILRIVRKETSDASQHAEKQILRIKEKYFISKRDVQPSVYLNMTDNWILFNIRYVVDVRGRRIMHTKLTQLILDEIQQSKNITIASTTLNIIGLPDVNIKKS